MGYPIESTGTSCTIRFMHNTSFVAFSPLMQTDYSAPRLSLNIRPIQVFICTYIYKMLALIRAFRVLLRYIWGSSVLGLPILYQCICDVGHFWAMLIYTRKLYKLYRSDNLYKICRLYTFYDLYTSRRYTSPTVVPCYIIANGLPGWFIWSVLS